MRKQFILISLSFFLFSYLNGQEPTRKIIDSTKNELKTAKGNKKIDCLNLLAEAYYDIWDEDDKQLDTACMYTEEAYKLAKNSGYKLGLGYALLWKAQCFGGRVDDNRNNNNSEANYTEAYNYANKAIQIGEEIKDYRLAGDVYDMLKWLERWKGDQAKFKNNVEKAIYYYEKSMPKKITGHLGISQCEQCKGNEGQLAWLYQLLAGINAPEKGITPEVREQVDKAIYYYKMTGDKSSVGNLYVQLGNFYYRQYEYRSAEFAYLQSMQYLHEAGDIEQELTVTNELCKTYETNGEFEKGIATLKKSVSLIEKYFKNKPAGSAKTRSAGQAYFWMSRLYKTAGDYEGALAAIRYGRQYYPSAFDSASRNPWMAEIGDVHRLLGNYDSAMYYLKDFQFTDNNPNNFGKMHLGYLYLDLKEYSKALSLILPYYKNLKTINRITPPIAQTLMIAGNASNGEKKYEQALQYAKEAQIYLRQMNGRLLMITNYKLLSDIYSNLKQPDSAFTYLKQYTKLKDSLITRQFYFKLNALKNESQEQRKTSLIQLLQKDNLIKAQQLQQQFLIKEQNEAQLSLLDKDNEIKGQQLQIKDQELKQQLLLKNQTQSQLILSDKENNLKDQRLKQQAFIRNALLGGLLLFILLGVFVFRVFSLKRKNEKLLIKKEQAELQQKVAELEMQALRAQMNPHFIFNCLNSINRFIFKNETTAASDYLTRFSRLIRMVLLHSQKKLVPLEDELEMLKLYLDMERLRFKNAFDYHITTTNAIENSSVFIPPLLLQPFCENAIWHGLMHKDGHGHLNIELNETNGVLHCAITDDGVGREKAEEFKSKSAEKEKSMGLKITKERLSLLNQGTTGGTFYEIEDLRNEHGEISGTRVQLKIMYKESVEEMV
ncbi:MAG: hypothetical protein E6H07_19845 [Bacteroidetes bacterium]|nr:MAG: hypothetical protein E6H07_19845 [Bacteroidota bacterium]